MGSQGDIAWPLSLSVDSSTLETDPQSRRDSGGADQGLGEARYFSLDSVNYWYDLKEPLKANDTLIIPFAVTVHHDMTRDRTIQDGELAATFTLQLSYR